MEEQEELIKRLEGCLDCLRSVDWDLKKVCWHVAWVKDKIASERKEDKESE